LRLDFARTVTCFGQVRLDVDIIGQQDQTSEQAIDIAAPLRDHRCNTSDGVPVGPEAIHEVAHTNIDLVGHDFDLFAFV
jgi:hypothetical protein